MRWMLLSMLLVQGALVAAQTPPPGTTLILYWEYPRAVQVDSFLVTYRVSTDPGGVLQQFRVPWTDAPTCDALKAEHVEDTFCAQPPSCWPPGVYSMSVQAERGGTLSAPTNWVSCQIFEGCKGDCERFAAANDALLHPTTAPPADQAMSATPQTALAPPALVATTPPGTLDALKRQLATLEGSLPQLATPPVPATAPT